jgi:hypothetical protein
VNELADRREMLRGLLTAGATASLGAPLAAATAHRPPDPVFGLIEAHKAAWARLLETESHTDDFEALEDAGRAVGAALDDITTTPPTTVAGMRAIIECVVEIDGHADYLPTLLRSSILRSPILPA